MTAPAPTVCPTCEGDGAMVDGDNYSCWGPCPDCSCEVCGQPTETPQICGECFERQDHD